MRPGPCPGEACGARPQPSDGTGQGDGASRDALNMGEQGQIPAEGQPTRTVRVINGRSVRDTHGQEEAQETLTKCDRVSWVGSWDRKMTLGDN